MEAQGIPQEEGHGSFPHVENAVMEIPTEYPGGGGQVQGKTLGMGSRFFWLGHEETKFSEKSLMQLLC